MIEKAEIYNLVSVKYKDSVVFVSLKRTQRFYTLFNNLVNLYIKFKVIALGKEVKEIYSINKDKIILNKNKVILKIELSEIQSIEQTSLEIESLQFNFLNRSKLTIPIFQSFTFLELQQDILHLPNLTLNPSTIIDSPAVDKKLVFEEKKIKTHLMKQIENKIDSNISSELKKLTIDVKNLYYRCLYLLISNLPHPLPQFEPQNYESATIISAIRKYIKKDLIEGRDNKI